MRAVRFAPQTALLLGLLAATGVTGCSAHGPVAATASPPASQAASASPSATSATVAASRTGSAPAAASSASPGSSGAAKNLVVSAAVRTGLLAAYAAYKSIPPSDVQGVPGSVYYAYQPATGTYWALARYEPTSGDSQTVQVGFQDGGSDGFFKRTGAGPWQVSLGGEPEICTQPRFFPQPVLAAWSLSTGAAQRSMC
jgi:hypothetical protein